MTASLLDTNVLVYANNADSPFHAPCRALVERAIVGGMDAVIAVQKPQAQHIFDFMLVATMMENDVSGIYTYNVDHFKPFKTVFVSRP